MTLNITISLFTLALFVPALFAMASGDDAGSKGNSKAPRVDFSYAIGAPHRITIGRPDASDRTLLDTEQGFVKMSWSYDNLAMANYPLLAYKPPPTQWKLQITPHIDGASIGKSRWTRLDAVLPALDNMYEDARGSIHLEAIGGMTAALIRIEASNKDSKPHQFAVHCGSTNPWGENPAWTEPVHEVGDNMHAGFNDRADRVLVLGVGADAYAQNPENKPYAYNDMVLVWNLKPGEKRSGWIVRPYHAYDEDLPKLRKHDWAKEWEQGKKEWQTLLGRALKITIPDPGVSNAYLACLADLFIMREPMLGGYMGTVIGTEQYRSGSSIDPAFGIIGMEQAGFHKEAADGFRCSIDMQRANGDWADYQGWTHQLWCASGIKSLTILEHYRLTGDKKYLEAVYPRMLASSRFQERMRERMRPAGVEKPLDYGLMPRGMGDGGLWNDGDLFGVFFPHNIWAVYADRCTMEVAQILGKTQDVPELKKIYETAYADLLVALDRGAIHEKDYRWMPGVSGKTSGSRWGVLNADFPCELLPSNHDLITGTLKYIESNISKGGLAVHFGWMTDGVWMAMSLDNVAFAHLARGEGDIAVKYLYAVLNHGSPFYTWCEERGQEPGSTDISGDKQHLWTPAAVVRVVRSIMVMEKGDGLNLALATDRSWLASGKPVGIAKASTHHGLVSYEMRFDAAQSQVIGEAEFDAHSTAKWVVLHVRLPDGLRVLSVDAASKATVVGDGSGIRWSEPRGKMKFTVTVGK